ncbi:MAG TPA: metallophosphoesterase family protein [Chitinivibrionales bacterium]|jgi:putative phosphoesterase|nr:metallophosphoesterase family protein [Chitinivibrionales bacterium]
MKIGVVSDTHRNIEYLVEAADWLCSRQKIAMLYHLGDDYDDVKALADKYIDIVQVPGIYDERYADGSLPKKIVENVLGVRIMLVHSMEKDVTPKDKMTVDIILHGHTHHSGLTVEDGLLCMNPGHLKGPKDKNFPPTFGLLDIQDKNIHAAIFGLDFKQVSSMEVFRSENRLYKA